MFRLIVDEWQDIRSQIVTAPVLLQQIDIKEQLKLIKERLGEHDAQLNQIYDAMENLLDEKVAQKRWEDTEKIGFIKR